MMATISRAVFAAQGAAEKGSLTRGYDALDVVQFALYAGMTLVVLVAVAMVVFMVREARAEHARNMPSCPYPYRQPDATTLVWSGHAPKQTVNLRKQG